MSKLWLSIFNTNVYAPPATARVQAAPSTDSTPFAVELRNVNLKGEPSGEVYYQLRACLYDAQYRRFFGRPWKGEWCKGDTNNTPQTIVFSQVVYFHIPYKDNSILLVIELVRRRVQPLAQDELSTLAWAVVRIMPSLPRNDIPQAQVEMFQGNAQVLTLLSEPVESDVRLRKSGISVQYGLRSHPALRKAYDFVPINTIIGAEETVPGLEAIDGSSVILDFPTPNLQSPAVIEHLTVHLGPLAQRIENEVCEFMNKERLLKDNRLFDGEVMDILERRIRVGVHNGWTYLHEPYIFHLSVSDMASDTRSLQRRPMGTRSHARSSSWDALNDAYVSGKGRLQLRNRIELNEMVRDPGIALVFYYQLLVALHSTKPNPPAKVVTMAWGVWSPFSEPNSCASTKPIMVNLPLRGGPTRNPDGVLCFTDFYSLPEITSQVERPSRTTKTNAIAIEFQFIPDRKKAEEHAPVAPLGEGDTLQVHPTQRDFLTSSQHAQSPTASSRQPTPAPPPRTGREPLPSAIRKTGPIAEPSAMQTVPYTIPPQFHWPVMGAFPYPAPIGHMTELSVIGPIHAPILAIQQQHWRAVGVPRNIMAILDQAKFQPVVDRHGESPQLVDVFDSTEFSLEADLKDPLICNEIVFQFMGLCRADSRSQVPDFAFFTFSFYRFPQVTTERLLLVAPEQTPLSADPMLSVKILRRVEPAGQLIVGPPGFVVKFVVDPEYLKPGERELFLEYLYNHRLCIDVWDGHSLMLLGSCLLPLRQLCRRDREAVQAYCQLPVVTTLHEGNQEDTDSIQPVMRALLYLKVACSGYPSAGGVDALLKMNMGKATRNAAVITHSLQRDSTGAELGTVERVVLRAQPLVARGVVIRPFLVTAKKLQEISDDLPEERRRKLQRLENIRQIEGYPVSKNNGPLTKDAYMRDIQTLRHLREQTKEKTIMSALFQAITTVHAIFPTLGSCEFMEFLLSNPYNDSITVNVELSDVELKVVTDFREWQYFKAVNNLLTPMDSSMFSLQPGEKEKVQIFLKPRENVYVPMKYQTFHAIDYPEYKESYHKPATRLLLPAKTVRAVFRRNTNGETISALVLQVEPQPHIVHQSFRFYHPENQFLAKYIRIQPDELWESAGNTVEYAYCTDPTVICELRTSGTVAVPQDVYIKVAAGTSPLVKRFHVLLYADAYLSKPVQIWQIYVHAMQKIDLSMVQGNGLRFPIVLKGDKASRLVRCFASCPKEIALIPNAPFVLDPGTTVDVQAVFRPVLAGERTMQITAVDVELHEMVKSWLIYTNVKPATITKAYQVVVKVGPPGRTLNKKVSYTNSYNVKKKFRVLSSREDLMTVKDPGVLELEAGASGAIGLRLNANVAPQVTEILLFINDEHDKNEDTYGVKAIFVA